MNNSTARKALGKVYVNAARQHVLAKSLDYRGGAVNARIVTQNFATGESETWTARIFLAEHMPICRWVGEQ